MSNTPTIQSTQVRITSTGQVSNIPGVYTPEQIVASLGDEIAGLSGMTPTVTVEGSTQVITFTQPTGEKG